MAQKRRPRQTKRAKTVKIEMSEEAFANLFVAELSKLKDTEFNDALALMMVTAAKQVGFDGRGMGGFPGYIEKNTDRMTNLALIQLAIKLPEGSPLDAVKCEMAERLERHQATKAAQAQAQDSTKH